MTPERFTSHQERLGMSRAAFARALGINKDTATAYAQGRWRNNKPAPIPLTVRLAISALLMGYPPAD